MRLGATLHILHALLKCLGVGIDLTLILCNNGIGDGFLGLNLRLGELIFELLALLG